MWIWQYDGPVCFYSGARVLCVCGVACSHVPSHAVALHHHEVKRRVPREHRVALRVVHEELALVRASRAREEVLHGREHVDEVVLRRALVLPDVFSPLQARDEPLGLGDVIV